MLNNPNRPVGFNECPFTLAPLRGRRQITAPPPTFRSSANMHPGEGQELLVANNEPFNTSGAGSELLDEPDGLNWEEIQDEIVNQFLLINLEQLLLDSRL